MYFERKINSALGIIMETPKMTTNNSIVGSNGTHPSVPAARVLILCLLTGIIVLIIAAVLWMTTVMIPPLGASQSALQAKLDASYKQVAKRDLDLLKSEQNLKKATTDLERGESQRTPQAITSPLIQRQINALRGNVDKAQADYNEKQQAELTEKAEFEQTERDYDLAYKQIETENKLRQTTVQSLLQVISWLAIAGTAYVAWENMKVARENMKVSQNTLTITQQKVLQEIANSEANLDLSRSRQDAERFANAAKLLAAESTLPEYLYGIFTLESIAAESGRDYTIVIELLGAFVRNKVGITVRSIDGSAASNANQNFNTTDNEQIEAVFKVIGRRKKQFVRLSILDLSGCHIGNRLFAPSGVSAIEVSKSELKTPDDPTNTLDFRNVNFGGSDLSGASFIDADLSGDNFFDCILKNVVFRRCTLCNACFSRAITDGARFEECLYDGIDVRSADFSNASADSPFNRTTVLHDEHTKMPKILK